MKRLSLIYLPALLAVALWVSTPAQAEPVTSSVQVPLAGEVFVPLSDGSFDSVALTGQVHVVTHVPQPVTLTDPIRIHVNLDQVSGVGSVTHLLYVATGANRVNLLAIPSDSMNLGFDLRAVGTPPNPIWPPDPIAPLDISFELTFNPDTGALTDVSIESMSVPVS